MQNAISLKPRLRFHEFDNEWEEMPLNKACTFYDHERIPLSENQRKNKKGDYPYYGASGIIDYLDSYIFDGEYILLAEDGANIVTRSSRIAFIAKGKFWVNNHAHVLKAKGSNYFLTEYLESLRYDKYNTGTAQPKLNAQVCKKIKVRLPTLAEQQKIADFLETVDNWIQNLKSQKEELEKYKKGMMQKIFSQEIRFKDDGGNDFPDWEEKKLGNLAIVTGGGTPDTKRSEYWNGEINWFTPTEINKKYVSESIRKITKLGLDKSSSSILPKGTVLFTSRATIGAVAICLQECATNQGFQSFIVNADNSNEFIYYWLIQNKKKFLRLANGSTFLEISKKEVVKIKDKFPSLEEQNKIASFLAYIDQLIELKNEQIDETESWKKGLMQEMFV